VYELVFEKRALHDLNKLEDNIKKESGINFRNVKKNLLDFLSLLFKLKDSN